MTTAAFWPFTDPLVPLLRSTTAPVDQLAAFQSEIGAPITRPRTTAQLHAWDVGIILYNYTQFDQFEDWFADDLAQGALPFFWLHPVRQDLRRFKFREGSYGTSFRGAERVVLSLPLLMLPGVNGTVPEIPWWPDE